MSEYIIKLPNGGAADECIRLRGYEKSLYGYELHEEIVRCRDCRHMRTIDLSVYYGEHKHDLDICIRVDGVQLNVEPDGYCAWGERKEI